MCGNASLAPSGVSTTSGTSSRSGSTVEQDQRLLDVGVVPRQHALPLVGEGRVQEALLLQGRSERRHPVVAGHLRRLPVRGECEMEDVLSGHARPTRRGAAPPRRSWCRRHVRCARRWPPAGSATTVLDRVDDRREVAERPTGRARARPGRACRRRTRLRGPGRRGRRHPVSARGCAARPAGCPPPRTSRRSASSRSGCRSSPYSAAHSIASAGCRAISASLAAATSTAALTWSLCPWVRTIAATRRSPTAARIAPASCAASTTRTSVSSPTSQTLFSTSHSPPSSANVPAVTTLLDPGRHQRTTTERRTSPRCIFANAASTSPSPIVSETKPSRSNRPWR